MPSPAIGHDADGSLRRPGLLGTLGAVAMGAGGSLPVSPFVLDRSGAWFFGSRMAGPHPPFNRLGVLLSVLGFVLLSLAWLDLLRCLRRSPGRRPLELLPVAAAWTIPFLVVAPQLSHDVYSYAAQGQLFSTGQNPTMVGVAALPPDPYRRLVDAIWLHSASPYGPLFTWLEGATVVVTAHRVLWSIALLRLEALAGVVLAGVSLPTIARSRGKDAAAALALGTMSPLVLLYLVSPAHNDALMVGLVVFAVALSIRGHPIAGILVAGVAAAIKVPALGATLFLGWTWPAPAASQWRRFAGAVAGLGLGCAVLEGAASVTGAGWHWVSELPNSWVVWNYFTPDDTAVTLTRALARVLGVQLRLVTAFSEVSLVGTVTGAVVCCWLLWRTERLGLPVALGAALLTVALVVPALHAWYLTWGLVLLAPAAGRRGTLWLAWLATVAALLWLPTPRTAPMALVLAALVAVLTGLALLLRHRQAGRAPWMATARPATPTGRTIPSPQAAVEGHVGLPTLDH